MLEKLKERIFYSMMPANMKAKPHPFDTLSLQNAGQPVYTEMTVKKATREGYRLSIFAYRSIRTIVQAVSGIPWIVLDKNMEEIKDHPFTYTWAHPNKQFSGQDNMEFIVAHLKLVGNSLVQPLIVGGVPKEFWMCMPDLIKPIPSKKAGEWISGYEVTTTEGKMYEVPAEQFLHFMQFDPGNPYWGVGDLQAAARTVDTDNEAQDTQKIQLQNRNVPPGVFQFDQTLDEAQGKEAQRQVKEKFLQKSKRGEPWVLGGGYKWQQMSLTPQEMDYINSRLSNKRDIAAAFGLDPWWLGDREHSSFNNVEQAKKSLYEDTAIPLLDDVRSTLNLKIAPMYGDDIYITYDTSNVSALRDDFGKKTEQAKTLWTMGVPFVQINDKLELGLEEFEGWDNSYLPFNLAPSGSSALSGETEIVKTKAVNLNTEEKKSMHWKRIDNRRVAWWNVVQKRTLPLYEAEGKAVIKAVGGSEAAIKAAINGQSKEWLKTIKAVSTVIVEDFGKEIEDDLGGKGFSPTEKKWTFDPFSAAVQLWVTNHATESVTSILGTNLEDVKRIIKNGTDNNLSNVQIAKELRQFYDDQSAWKAMRTARTETSQAAGYGQRESARQSGVVRKKLWISSRDERVRDEHAALDTGKGVPFNEPYSNGEMYVGEHSINCRCVEGYLT